MLFTPIKGNKRIEMNIEEVDIPRGKENKGRIFTVKEKETGKLYKAEVIACSLPTCYCDARLIDK